MLSYQTPSSLDAALGISSDVTPLLRIDVPRNYDDEARRLANNLGSIALVHYQARSYWQRKDLDHSTMDQLVDALIRRGLTVLFIDVDRRTPLQPRAGLIMINEHEADWAGISAESKLGNDPLALVALAAYSQVNLGIDSGPGHLFGCVKAKAVICWRGLHPLHNYGPAPDLLHAVPMEHERNIYGDQAVGTRYVRQHYRHVVYEHQADLIEIVCDELDRKP